MVVAQKAFVTILVVKPHDFARRRILFTISISRERTSPPVKTITLISGYNEVHVFIKSAITFSSKEDLLSVSSQNSSLRKHLYNDE